VQLPVFNATRFEAFDRGGHIFVSGDNFQLDGAINETSGHVRAKCVTGKSPDHEIIFGPASCTNLCRWNLTIVVNGSKSVGQGIFLPTNNLTLLTYAELGASMQKVVPSPPPPPPNCGNVLPVFNSSFYKVYMSQPEGVFQSGDFFLLNGSVQNTSGRVAAKHVTGKSPDHEIVFGNSTCEGTTRRWPVTVMLHGNTSSGYCTFSTRSDKVSIVYSDMNVRLLQTDLPCGDMLNKTSCTNVIAGQCSWCVSKDNVHSLCFAKSQLPDIADWDCSGVSLV